MEQLFQPTGLPQIIGPEEADGYLARMGIDTAAVRDALGSGELAARNLTPFFPVTAPGFSRWSYTVGTLREELQGTGHWRSEDRSNRPYLRHLTRSYTLSVLGGNTETGSESLTACPNVQKRKGRATEEFVLGGQLAFPEIVEYLSDRTDPDAPPPGTWFLIYYRDDGELRSEISLPEGIKDGRFTGWRIRVILPVISYKTMMRRPLDAGEHDVEFTVEERGRTA